MKTKIDNALSQLLGWRLVNIIRNPGLDCFLFGRPGSTTSDRSNSYALHVQCSWRLAEQSSIVVGYDDRYFAAGSDPFKDYPDFDCEPEGANRRDERVAMFFASKKNIDVIVTSVVGSALGDVHLDLSDGCSLDVIPCNSLKGEHWRLLPPDKERDHFVVTGQGIEEA